MESDALFLELDGGGSKATPGEPCQVLADGVLLLILIKKLESCDNIVQDISGGNRPKWSFPATASPHCWCRVGRRRVGCHWDHRQQ